MTLNKKTYSWIPNFITMLNLLSGTMAVFFAIDGELGWAGVFICIAAIFDFFDGFTARLLKAYSIIGKHLDSLADIISFGLAPGAIAFTLFEYSIFFQNQPIYEIDATWKEWLALYSSFLIPLFSAYRLAKFNADKNQETSFRGLPTPANALLWASFGLMLEFPEYEEILLYIFTTKNLLILVIITSVLLVTSIPMFSLKFSNFSWKDNWIKYIFLMISLVLLLFFNIYGLSLIILLYIFASFVYYILNINSKSNL